MNYSDESSTPGMRPKWDPTLQPISTTAHTVEGVPTASHTAYGCYRREEAPNPDELSYE